jgi:hypothetical protein
MSAELARRGGRARGAIAGAAARIARVGCTVLLVACTQDLAAPGTCPDFCQSAALTIADTVLRAAISLDSAYGRPVGYVAPHNALTLLAADLPGLRDSRPIFRTVGILTRIRLTTDTTTFAVTGVDSLRLSLTITRRDTASHNLKLAFYKIPLTIDSSTAFAALTVPFAAAPVRRVNVDSLLAQPGGKDNATGDSVVVDSTNHFIRLLLKFDAVQAPLVLADTGRLAFGIRVSADKLPSIALGASEYTGLGPAVTWFLKVDSLGSVARRTQARVAAFDAFVFDPPALPLGTALVVGGVPATRSVLRITLPRAIRDSARVIRATLDLIPTTAPQGIAADSFQIVAHPVVADFGPKSLLSATHTDTTRMYIALSDTVHIDVTDVLRFWTTDTVVSTTLILRQIPEGADFAEFRFHGSRDVGLRPTLHITYVPRYVLGKL